jgi:hypothetical protein
MAFVDIHPPILPATASLLVSGTRPVDRSAHEAYLDHYLHLVGFRQGDGRVFIFP